VDARRRRRAVLLGPAGTPPLGEALQLWTDLRFRGVEAKFLYFPDENHWILKPSDARLWYETVFAFLDHHVLGKDWTRPSLL
jgi:dipeptidyl aminopeptidase/acylaminoacyl peptidase